MSALDMTSFLDSKKKLSISGVAPVVVRLALAKNGLNSSTYKNTVQEKTQNNVILDKLALPRKSKLVLGSSSFS